MPLNMPSTSADKVSTSTDVSVVVPVYGCRGCLEELVQRVSAAITSASATCTFEIVLVDDASPDGAWQRIAELALTYSQVRGYRLSRNFGQHAAISAGLCSARGHTIIVMDCDLQDIPEEIPALLEALNGDYDIALAQRVSRNDPYLKKKGSQLFYGVLGWLTDSRYDHTTANFGAYSRRVVDILNALPETDRFLPLMAQWTGFRTIKVPVKHGKRTEGKSGYTARQLLRLASNVAISFSDKPLRLVVKLALLFAAVAVAITIFSVYRYSVGDVSVAGYTSIVASIWLIGSVTMFCTGVVGLYLGRLYNQAKGRPHFVIAATSETDAD